MNELKQLPGILQVQVNHILQSRKQPDDDFFTNQWHHFNEGLTGGTFNADFDSDLAWDLTTGGLTEEGDTIVVCVIDDGLDIHHPDLLENLWLNRDEIPNNSIDDDLNGYIDDYYGWNTYLKNDSFALGIHGTLVCGLVAAKVIILRSDGYQLASQINVYRRWRDEANAIESYQYPGSPEKLTMNHKAKQEHLLLQQMHLGVLIMDDLRMHPFGVRFMTR
ncbi:MAG: S8 family serine peptidase [Saprospiraceae bacterium]|nr:S8 family serine peptidase [Candidatus Defluviibacterium haderslevense]